MSDDGLFRAQASASFLRPDAPGTIVSITPPWTLTVFGVMATVFIVLAALGVFGRAQVIVEGRGVVKLDQPSIVLHAPHGGRIRIVQARAHDHGKAGDLLLAYEASEAAAAQGRCVEDLATEQRDLATLDARLASWGESSTKEREASLALVLLAQLRAQREKVTGLAQRCEALATTIAKSVLAFPADATVTEIAVTAGSDVKEGDRLAVLAPAAARLVGFVALPESHRSEIAAGQAVRMRFDALPSTEVGAGAGTVTRVLDALPVGVKIDATTDAASAGVFAEVRIDAMPAGAGPQRGGMTFGADLLTRRVRLAALVLGDGAGER